YMSGDFQAEIECLGIEASPSFVREPEGNGVAERFIRTLKENLLMEWSGRTHRVRHSLQRHLARRSAWLSYPSPGESRSMQAWSEHNGPSKVGRLKWALACTSAASCRRILGGERWLGGKFCQGRQPPKAGAAGPPLQGLPPSHTLSPSSTAGNIDSAGCLKTGPQYRIPSDSIRPERALGRDLVFR